MPIFLIGSGLILIITGVKGDPSELWSLVKGDFTGQNNFVYWLVSILVLGFLGYIKQLQSLSRLFIVLILVVLLLDNRGFFAQLQAFINSTQSGGASGSWDSQPTGIEGTGITTPQGVTIPPLVAPVVTGGN